MSRERAVQVYELLIAKCFFKVKNVQKLQNLSSCCINLAFERQSKLYYTYLFICLVQENWRALRFCRFSEKPKVYTHYLFGPGKLMVAKSKRKSVVQKVLKSCTFMLLVSVLCQLSEIDLNVTIICSVYTWRKL